jgi:tetratricopeptide (TPR) repeat protein
VLKTEINKLVIAAMFWTALGFCQGSRGFLAGTVEPVDGSGSNLYVEVRDVANRTTMEREELGIDGSFRFRDLPCGSYEIRVIAAVHNDTLVQEFIEVNPLGGQIVLHMPRMERARPVSGLVSVRELQTRVPKKAFQAFVKAQHCAESDKPAEAIEQLRPAIETDPNWRDAHVNLGAELMKSGRYEEGLAELQDAIRIGPATAMMYTNYAAALASLNRGAEGEKAVREALRLDGSFWRAHYLLGHILSMPSGHIVAAQVLLRNGDRQRPRRRNYAST